MRSPGFQLESHELFANHFIVEITRNLIFKIFKQMMFVALLVDRRIMKKDIPAIGPCNPLSDKTSPNIGHTEITPGRQVKEWECVFKPRRILRVKRTPGAVAQRNISRSSKCNGQWQYESIDTVDIGILITQALLYRTIGAFGFAIQRNTLVLKMFERKSPRPDRLRRIVTVNIGSSLVNQKMGSMMGFAAFPKFYGREIIIIGFNDHCGTVFHSQQVTKVFP